MNNVEVKFEENVENILKKTGRPVYDPSTSLTFIMVTETKVVEVSVNGDMK